MSASTLAANFLSKLQSLGFEGPSVSDPSSLSDLLSSEPKLYFLFEFLSDKLTPDHLVTPQDLLSMEK